MRYSFLIVTFVIAYIPLHGYAASFDCTRATTQVEKLICSEPQLSKSDEDLMAIYAKVLKETADPRAIRKQQREWLSNVRNRCADVICLENVYKARITQVSSVGRGKVSQSSKVIKSDAEACRVVAEHANRGVLNDLSLWNKAIEPKAKDIERIFGKHKPWGGLSYWQIDLDHDGISDDLVVRVEGTMSVSTAYALSGKKGSTVSELNDIDEGYYDLDVLRVGGRYYVLSRYGDQRLGNLWRLGKNGEFMSVCKFSPRKEPVVELVVGKEKPVCKEVELNRINHVAYNLMHALGTLPGEDRFWSKHPIDGLAQVDLDNDGRLDNVVRIDFAHGGGRGCGATYIAVTDDTRTSIPDTELNRLLLEELGGYPCGPNLDVFVHGGITYVDAQAEAGNRTIYKVKENKAEMVCEFRGRLIHNVVNANGVLPPIKWTLSTDEKGECTMAKVRMNTTMK